MTTLIIGSTRLAADLVVAFEHGDPDYVWLVGEGMPGGAEVVVDPDPTTDSLLELFHGYAVDAVVNAAEPYAEVLSAMVTSACGRARLPVLRAVPPSFEETAGSSRWSWVSSFDAARREAASCPGEILVALNPLELAERLGDLGGRSAHVHRRRTSTDPSLPAWAREPARTRYGLGGAIASIDEPDVSLLVAADSGDTEVRHLLEAADHRGRDVVVVRRPELATGPGPGGSPPVAVVTDVLSVLTWLDDVRVTLGHGVR
jgi:precorrin-6x reductase